MPPLKIWYLNFGNTHVTAWNGAKKTFRFRTKSFRPVSFFLKAGDIDEVWLASVVPQVSKRFEVECKRRAVECHRIGVKDVPVSPAYSESLGIDRLLNVFAASQIVKETRRVAGGIVIDLGTALTIDAFRRRKHLGGWILPGLFTMSESLFKKTALLPHINVTKKDFQLGLGRSTRESIAAGQVHMLKGLVEEARKLLKIPANALKIYLTGGKAKDVNLKAKEIPMLTLKGLKFLRELK